VGTFLIAQFLKPDQRLM